MMSPAHAAYELGLNCHIVRYCIGYLWRFGHIHQRFITDEDPEGGLRKAERLLEEAVDALASCMPPEQPSRLRMRIVDLAALTNRLVDAYRAGRGFEGKPWGSGMYPGQRQWLELTSQAKASLRERPGLRRWYRLGASIGACWVHFVNSTPGSCLTAHDARPSPRDLLAIMTAAKDLSDSALRRVPVAQACAELADDGLSYAQLVEGLHKAVGEDLPEDRIEGGNAFGLLSRPLSRLDKKLREGLAVLPRMDLRLTDLGQHFQAILDDTPYEVNLDQFKLLRALLRAGGEPRTRSQLRNEEWPEMKNLEQVRIDRYRKTLPPPLRDCVQSQSGHHGGYRLVLD